MSETELIPAERLAETVSGRSCQGYPKWLVPLLREAQRNALEAAAKAVKDAARCMDNGYYAEVVRKLIPNDPAPAEFQTGESCCIHCASKDVVEDTSAGERPYGRAFRCKSCGERWMNADYPAPAGTTGQLRSGDRSNRWPT
jgi:hypothetical protein